MSPETTKPKQTKKKRTPKKTTHPFTAKALMAGANKVAKFLLWLLWDFSGVRYICSKIRPPLESKKPERKPATFFLWVLGIYTALFGIASQRYENRVDIIENRANAIFTQLATDVYKKALERIPRVQNMPCPQKPYILSPETVFASLLGREKRYDPIVELLIETVEDWKDKLAGVYLREAKLEWVDLKYACLQGASLSWADLRSADLRQADLREASLYEVNLSGAYLQDVDLRGAKDLTVEMLLQVRTLYGVKGLSPSLVAELKAKKPGLFKKPRGRRRNRYTEAVVDEE